MRKIIFLLLSIMLFVQNFLLSYETKKNRGVNFSTSIQKENNRAIEKEIRNIDKIKREYLRKSMLMTTQNIVDSIYYEIDYRLRDNIKPKLKNFYDTMINRVADSYKTDIIEINYVLKNKAFVFVETKMYDFEKIMELYNDRYLSKIGQKYENITQKEEVEKMLETMEEMIKIVEKYEYTSNTQLRLAEKENDVWKFTEIEQNK